MPFTVQDTRTFASPRTPIALAPAPTQPQSAAAPSARLAHDAASTGQPGWQATPTLTDPARLNARTLAVAHDCDPSLTRTGILARSPTLRSGIMPWRPAFLDRLAALISLLNSAFHFQLAGFNRLQTALRAEGEQRGVELIPEDVVNFDFVLQWRELRDELTGMLRSHFNALNTMSNAPRGSSAYVESCAVAQRTSPDVLHHALSAMTIFDLHKWGADAPPFDALTAPCDDGPAVVVEPCSPTNLHSPSSWDGAHLCIGSNPHDNGSFVPSPGDSSRQGSPYSSFGSAPGDYVPPACALTGSVGPSAAPNTAEAATANIERPPRAASLADCLCPDSIAERQAASTEYRMSVLRAVGIAA